MAGPSSAPGYSTMGLGKLLDMPWTWRLTSSIYGETLETMLAELLFERHVARQANLLIP
jgi:hypothetical protein